jgi:hypothetical protein
LEIWVLNPLKLDLIRDIVLSEHDQHGRIVVVLHFVDIVLSNRNQTLTREIWDQDICGNILVHSTENARWKPALLTSSVNLTSSE